MSINITGDWRELFDVALFEPNRARLRQRIKNAKNAIRNRLDALMLEVPADAQDESERIASERLALSDALTTLAELHKIVYPRKSRPAIQSEEGKASGQSGPR